MEEKQTAEKKRVDWLNYLLGMVTALAMILVTGNVVRGGLAFLVSVGTLAAFRRVNANRCWYCSRRKA